MKLFIILLVAVSCASARGAVLTNNVPPKVEQNRLFMEAMALKQSGRYAEAAIRLRRLAELNPDEPIIKEMLADVQAQGAISAYGKMVAQLIVPEVNVRGAAPKDVLNQLQEDSKNLTPDKSQVNIIWQIPPDTKLLPVTMKLVKVPLLDVVRYVTESAGLRYRIDSRAIVITLPETAAAAPAPKEPTPANVKSE